MSRAGRMIYKPTSLACSIAGSLVATRIFNRLWSRTVGDGTPPSPETLDRRMVRDVLPSALLHGAILGVTRAVFQRAGARSYRRVTGGDPAAG